MDILWRVFLIALVCAISAASSYICYRIGWMEGVNDSIYYMNALSGRWDENFSHDSFTLSDLNRIYGRKEKE